MANSVEAVLETSEVTTTDIGAVVVAVLALGASVVFFVLNRRHTTNLFETTQFPDLDFVLEVLTSWKAIREQRITMDATFLPHHTWIEVTWRNKTKVEGVNLHATIVLTRGLKRVRWVDSDTDWAIVGALAQGEGTIGGDMNDAIAKLCSDCLVKRHEDSAKVLDDWLETLPEKVPPELGLYTELRWRAPLRGSKLLKKGYAAAVQPHTGKAKGRAKGRGASVEWWEARPRSPVLPFWLASWRPRTYKIGE